MILKFRPLLCFFLAFALTVALNLAIPAGAVAESATIMVGSASSLQDVLKELTPLFQSAHPGITVKYSFTAPGAVQQQIERGAPIDVFVPGSTKQMDALQAKGLILPETRRNLVTNSIVLVVPRNSSLKLTDFRQLTNSEVKRIAIGEPRSVPVGQYAEEVFRSLGIWEQVRPKLVMGNTARNVLASVESGNADAAVIFATDAKISQRVRQVAVAPKGSHSPIVYPIAVVSASRQQKAARTYVEFLTSSRARPVFRKYGFGTV